MAAEPTWPRSRSRLAAIAPTWSRPRVRRAGWRRPVARRTPPRSRPVRRREGEPDFLEWRANVTSKGRALLMLFLFSDVGDRDAPTRLALVRTSTSPAGSNLTERKG